MDNKEHSLAYDMCKDLKNQVNYLKTLLLINLGIIVCLSVALYFSILGQL